VDLEKIEKRLQEIPALIEQLRAEHNQLLGYRQALADIEDKTKDKKGKK
tara:strand:+ start:361 stop:507 length:147 start_codon:yes stop_codon:yes gene_type:complete